MALHRRSRRARVINRLKEVLKCLKRNRKVKEPSFKAVSYQETIEEKDGCANHIQINHKTRLPAVISGRKGAPFHLTLLGLPRELRDMIYSYVYCDNGHSYVQQQLLGFPRKDYSTYSEQFRVLQTCRQIYAEAYCHAYRLSCFYWFKSYSSATLDKLCQRLSPHQTENIRHIAFWSNPYLYEDFLDAMPDTLRLTKVTVCSNFMSGHVPATTIHGRMLWLLRNVRKLQTLRSFHFLTGCGISPANRKTSDWDFAAHLRRAFDAREYRADEGHKLEVGTFDPETLITTIVILPDSEDSGKRRRVELKIASVYEPGFDSG